MIRVSGVNHDRRVGRLAHRTLNLTNFQCPWKKKYCSSSTPLRGERDKALFWSSLQEALSARPFDYSTFSTTGEDDTQQLRHLLGTQSFTRVIVVGGDGTVKMAAELLLHQPTALGIIPMGSAERPGKGNWGIPSHPRDALRVALGPQTTQIDTIQIDQHGLCVHLSDLGMNAILVEHYAAEKLRGMWGYARVFVRTVVKRRRFRVSLDEEHMHLYRSVYMLMLANARMYGTGAVVNPTGAISDGYFEVILLKDFRWWDLPRLFYPHRRPRLEREEVVSVKSISVACNRPVHFQMDGEYRGKVTRLRAAINPQGLRVLVPR